MGGHDPVRPGADGLRKREHVLPPQALWVLCDDWQVQMRVHRGGAVSGEMLGRRQDSRALRGLNVRDTEAGDVCRIVTECADPDDWVLRVAVDVQHGGVVDVHPERTELHRCDPAGGRGVRGPPRGAECHRAGEDGEPVDQPVDETAFLVDGNQQRG